MQSSPGTPDRHRLAGRVEHVDRGVGDRPADRRQRRASGPAAASQAERSSDVGLGRAVEVDQPRRRPEERRAPARASRRQRLAAGDQLAQPAAAPPCSPALGEQPAGVKGGSAVDPLRGQPARAARAAIAASARRGSSTRRPAGEQRRRQLPDGRRRSRAATNGRPRPAAGPGRRRRAQAAGWPEPGAASPPPWAAGRAGGVDDVGEVLRAAGRRAAGGCGRSRPRSLPVASRTTSSAPSQPGGSLGERRVLGEEQPAARRPPALGQALRGIGGVERQVGAAGLEDRQQR